MAHNRLVTLAVMLTACVVFAEPGLAQPGGRGGPPGRPGTDYGNNPGNAQGFNIGTERFEGAPERLAVIDGARGHTIDTVGLTARDGDVRCSSMTATFQNGRRAQLMAANRNGMLLARDRPYRFDVPAGNRNVSVTRLDLTCRAERGGATQIDITADFGRDFPPARQGNDNRNNPGPFRGANIGIERFEGALERQAVIDGARGRTINTIELTPLDGDVRCSSMFVTFQDGRRVDVLGATRNGLVLAQNRPYRFDVPGGNRAVTRLDLTCRAERGGNTQISIAANN